MTTLAISKRNVERCLRELGVPYTPKLAQRRKLPQVDTDARHILDAMAACVPWTAMKVAQHLAYKHGYRSTISGKWKVYRKGILVYYPKFQARVA